MALSGSAESTASQNSGARVRSLLNMVVVANSSRQFESTDSSSVSAKDFDVQPRSSVLCLRQDIVDALYACGGRTLTDLLTLAEERPAILLGYLPEWDQNDLSNAVTKMKQELRGTVADHVLNFGVDSMRVALAVRTYEGPNNSGKAAGGNFKI